MNSFDLLDPRLLDAPSPEIATSPDGHPGYTPAMAAEDTVDAVWQACGSAARSFPKSLWIDPKDWDDKARDNDKYGTWPRNYVDRFTNQDPTHECTCHSLGTNFAGARNRQRGVSYPDGPKKGFRYPESGNYGSVWVSPLSIYAEANPGRWGGANVRQVMEIACRRGFLPDKIQPHDYGFKHSLQGTTGKGNSNQSSGPWVSLSQFPDGWQETAKWFRPVEVIFAASWEEAVCLVLHGIHYSVGRDGHAVPWCRWLPGQGMEYEDSYDKFRYDSVSTVRRAWQGGFGIATATAPDDWSKPAG